MYSIRITLEIVLRLVATGPAEEVRRAEVAAADAEIAAARATRAPSLGAELRAGLAPGRLVRIPDTDLFVNGQTTLDDTAIQGRHGLTVTFEQVLVDFGQSRAGIDAAGHARSATTHDADADRDARARDAAAAFYRWAAAEAIANVRRADADAARDAAFRAEHLIAAGGPASDADLPLVERVRAELAASRADSDARAARAALEMLTGPLPAEAVPDVPAHALPDVPAAPPPSASATAAPDHARAALLERLAAAQAQVRALERARRPVIAGLAALGVRVVGDDGLVDRVLPAWEVGLALRVPLVDRTRDAALARARADVRRLGAALAAHDRQRAIAVSARRSAHDDALARVTLADALVTRCEQALSRAESLAHLGAEANAELTRARAALRAAQLERTLAAIDAAATGFAAGRHVP